jgi:RNA polymerase sigma factor (sigma-70 family)
MSAHWDALASDVPALAAGAEEVLSVHNVIRRHHDSLVRFLKHRLRVTEDAADIAQEAYIRLMHYEGSKEIQSAPSLLFRIAINVANDMGRAELSRHRADHCSIEDVDLAADAPTPEREIAAEQDLELAYQAIAELPPKCQQVFLLSRAKRMTYPEIAAHCGISVKMVEKHISHALQICARKVGVHRTASS